ncbi:MAG: indole-3-glycerol phosphate synthase TrpC [candidate division Zixibacteria bacterium]|nr:indole-3-glycerol phosphate synthase TrpC [candidate division Zixibacteria bacterium]
MLEQIIAAEKIRLGQIDVKGRIKEWKSRLGEAPPARASAAFLRNPGGISLIGEIKRASPSAGVLKDNLDVGQTAAIYRQGGAAAISVLTQEHFFRGSLGDLMAVRKSCKLPILRKDFIFTEYQVWESRWAGADFVLLIASIIAQRTLQELFDLCCDLGMDALVEVHDEEELEMAVRIGSRMIGINNRSLETLELDRNTALRLAGLLSGDVVKIAESGISGRQEVCRLHEAGFDAVLVGEAILRSPDPAGKISALLGLQKKSPSVS